MGLSKAIVYIQIIILSNVMCNTSSKSVPFSPNIQSELLNPKQNKAKLLVWALLSQNPTTSTTSSSSTTS